MDRVNTPACLGCTVTYKWKTQLYKANTHKNRLNLRQPGRHCKKKVTPVVMYAEPCAFTNVLFTVEQNGIQAAEKGRSCSWAELLTSLHGTFRLCRFRPCFLLTLAASPSVHFLCNKRSCDLGHRAMTLILMCCIQR